MKTYSAKQYEDDMIKRFSDTFSNHLVREEVGPGHWWLCKKNQDGKWDITYGAEIVVIKHGGKVLVDGDIGPIVFASYGRFEDPMEVVRWIGSHNDVGSYVLEKAKIGMCGSESVISRVPAIAATQIREYLDQEDTSKEEIDHLKEALHIVESDLDCVGEAAQYIAENVQDGWEIACRLGVVPSPSVFACHASLRRLATLYPRS